MAQVDGDRVVPIAVIGLGCRFPGDATSPEQLWSMMTRGESAWSEFPGDRLNIETHFHPSGERQGSIPFRGAHFLKQNVAAFDNTFFSISSDEAKAIDPQQRMLLEVAVEALDNAGVDRSPLRRSRTGVWIGSFVKDYEQITLRDPDNSPTYGATGNSNAIMSNRISYFLDISGPSMTIETGCSASLVCVHNACQALRNREVNLGLAGGAGLILAPNTMMPMAALSFLSSHGKCYTFDARANGYGRGEGIGVVVLKRLDDAIRDNDNIRAIIRGSQVNQDGRTPGITLPSAEAQTRNIREVYQLAGLEVDKTAFVECHGTGTRAGDVTELEAVSKGFCANRTPEKPIYVGSVKTNIGHLEGCAGLAGLVKAVLTVKHGLIPKHLNFVAPGNPAIDFKGWKVKVPIVNTAWPVEGLRRASVNCFGFGGTNAHVILDDAAHYLNDRGLSAHHDTDLLGDIRDPSVPDTGAVVESFTTAAAWRKSIKEEAKGYDLPRQDFKSQLFVFSAHDQQALKRMIEALVSYLEARKCSLPSNFLEDLAYTLGCRRTKLQWRTAVFARSVDDLLARLQQADETTFFRTTEDNLKSIAFVFSGQSAQWYAMGRELMGFDIFLKSIADASVYMKVKLGSPFSLLAELLSDAHSSNIDQTHISQPASTAVQVALVDLLIHYYGIIPDSVVGHSSGEIAAAYAAGAISRETAWELAYRRGRCASSLEPNEDRAQPKGRMLAVGLSAADASLYVEQVGRHRITIACVNSPASVTLSGDSDAIQLVQEMLNTAGIFNRILAANVAYHSPHMGRCVDEYLDSIAHLQPQVPVWGQVLHPHKKGNLVTITDVDFGPGRLHTLEQSKMPAIYSSVRGRAIHWSELTAEYWCTNMISPVQFLDAMNGMLQRTDGKRPDILLELGPHPSLHSSIQQILDQGPSARSPAQYYSMLRRDQDAVSTALSTVGQLWSRGCNVEMTWVVMRNLQMRRPRLLVDLPSYSWNHEALHWHESHMSKANRLQMHGRYDLIGRPSADSIPFQPRWRGFLRTQENPWIDHHKVQRTTIYPAAGMVAMVIEAAIQVATAPCMGIQVSQFKIDKAMLVPSSAHGLEYALNMNTLVSEQPQQSNNLHLKSVTYRFFIYSKPLDCAWQEHGSGLLRIYYEQLPSEERHYEAYTNVKAICDEHVDPRQLYESFDVVGLNYGPLFRNISTLQKGDGSCTYTIRVPDTKSSMPEQFEYPHVIHPATLDSVFQTAFSLSGELKVPSYIGSIFISTSGKLDQAGEDLVGFTTARSKGLRDAKASFTVSDKSWECSAEGGSRDPLITVEDMRFTALSAASEHGDADRYLPSHHSLCSELVWEAVVDVANASPSELSCGIHHHAEDSIFTFPADISLLVPSMNDPTLGALCSKLTEILHCNILSLDQVQQGDHIPEYCISLLEAVPGQHFVWDWREQDFLALRKVVSLTKALFWITQGAQVECANPKASLFMALARTIHSEIPKVKSTSLDLPPDTDLSAVDSSKKIISVFVRAFLSSQRDGPTETEYAYRDEQLLVSRLIPLKPLNKVIEQGSGQASPELQHWDQHDGRPLKLVLPEAGNADSLYWDDDTEAILPLEPLEVKIKVRSVSLGVFDAQSFITKHGNHTIGSDAFGVVESMGKEVKDLAIGDLVLAGARSSLRDFIRCPRNLVHKIPESMSHPSFAVLPTSLTVARYAFHNMAKPLNTRTILIRAATGSFGHAVVVLAKKYGSTVLAVVKNDEHRQIFQCYHHLPEEQVLKEDDPGLDAAIVNLTRRKGVDIIFDPTFQEQRVNYNYIAHCGRIVRLSEKHLMRSKIEDPRGKVFDDHVLNLEIMIKRSPGAFQESLECLCCESCEQWLPPAESIKRYDYSQLSEALSALASGHQVGPVYLEASESTQVLVLPRRPPTVKDCLKQDGTYVITGQGGLGLHIAKFLASNGAKNIALLSRSGASSEAAQAVVTLLKKRDVNVQAFKVDICEADSLQQVVAEMSLDMPPISGLFQCAAVLRDAVFDNMTYTDWQTATGPKTIGSWNLYEVFPRSMDFFIFLSSAAGVIGNRGQANYAAGNAFQDALARHINTTEKSMRAVSLDLGPVLGAGMLAEDPRTLDLLKGSGFFGIRLQDFEKLIGCAITGHAYDNERVPAQIVTAVGTGGLIRQNRPADPYWTRTALFTHLNRVDLPEGANLAPADSCLGVQSVQSMLSQVTEPEGAWQIVKAGLMQTVAKTLNIKPEDMDEGMQPAHYGVDSLVAVHVRNWVYNECGVDVSVFEVLGDQSIAALSDVIVGRGGFGMSRREG